MTAGKKRVSIGNRIYRFVGVMVFIATLAVAVISYYINAGKIDAYFKGLTLDTARNYASMLDAAFLKELRTVVESDEFQKLRDKAEEEDNEKIIEDMLRDKGLWDKYNATRRDMIRYLGNMEDVKYLYIVVWGGKDDNYDMYLIDADDVPLYQTGYYEEREEELLGIDASREVPPTISNGDWGWLCSAYAPVYDDNGELVCQVGCDVGMDDIMKERQTSLFYMILAAIAITIVIIAGMMILIKRHLISPLDMITKEMKKFAPSEDHDRKKSGVISLDINSHDEIEDIYNEIRSMQIRILDYLADITTIQKEKEKAENDIRNKEKELGEISREAYRDALTCVGSKIAFARKTEEMNKALGDEGTEFAIVMIDVNFLKNINDDHGHAAGDEYLKGCCKVVCQIYKHSPVFRIGGDEFVVILTGDDYRDREEKLIQVRASFEASYRNMNIDPWLRFSAASGMSEYKKGDDDVEQVLHRADKEMYEEKARFKQANGIDPASR